MLDGLYHQYPSDACCVCVGRYITTISNLSASGSAPCAGRGALLWGPAGL